MKPEQAVEAALIRGLTSHGFETVKLTTAGTTGVPDRMILMPKWSPGPPVFVECKAPGQYMRQLQAATADEWRWRGMDVRPVVSDRAEVFRLVDDLLNEALKRKAWNYRDYMIAKEASRGQS